VAELAERMSSLEFGQWQEYLAEEPVEVSEQKHRARLLAAVHNGQLRRRDGQIWDQDDFFRKPWQPLEPPVAPAAPVGPTAEQLRAQVAAMCGITR